MALEFERALRESISSAEGAQFDRLLDVLTERAETISARLRTNRGSPLEDGRALRARAPRRDRRRR
jgi:hypothetical protein